MSRTVIYITHTCEPVPEPWHSFQTEVSLEVKGHNNYMNCDEGILQPRRTTDEVACLRPDSSEQL